MHPNPHGLDGIPTGDPGFTIAIEVNQRLSTLSHSERAAILAAVGSHLAHLDRSPLGNARIVFEILHTGWWESGQAATQIVGSLREAWPVVGIEICRSDLWGVEPFLDHDADVLLEMPDWCRDVEPRYRSTVLVEVEPERTPSGKRRTARPLPKCYRHTQDARLSESGATRPQLIVETRGPAEHGTQLIAKAAHFVSNAWSITRIRSVRADIYQAETLSFPMHSEIADRQQTPDWQLVSNGESDRYVVVTDPNVDMNGWSADITTFDGHTLTRPFSLDTVWIDDAGTANIVADGSEVTAWTARIESRTNLVALHREDTRLEIDGWDSMAAWLVESMHGKPVGLVIELGPSDYGPELEEEGVPVVCAQIQVLDDGVHMLRRSRAVLGHLMLTDYSADGLELDTWHNDDHFDDCTDGYLFTRDTRLIANTCIAWFRDNTGMTDSEELGCSYRFSDELPRSL